MERLPRPSKSNELNSNIELETLQGREALKTLASTHLYVFHGSPVVIDELEPRQSFSAGKPDGLPAVSAAPDEGYELAIFMALIGSGPHQTNRPRGSRRSSFATNGVRAGEWHFKANQLAFEDASSPNALGYVYVFDKAAFVPYAKYEWRCYDKIRPRLVIPVTAQDLPSDISIQNDL